jgi:hypothetical protein
MGPGYFVPLERGFVHIFILNFKELPVYDQIYFGCFLNHRIVLNEQLQTGIQG